MPPISERASLFLEGSQVPPFAVFLRVVFKMKVKMNMKMKTIKMRVEYWCIDTERKLPIAILSPQI